MSLFTRKPDELEQLETLGNNTNVLLEDGGSIKRFPAKSFGSVKTVNGAEPDDNGDVEIEIPEGFSGSWNALTDKPFGEVQGEVIHLYPTYDDGSGWTATPRTVGDKTVYCYFLGVVGYSSTEGLPKYGTLRMTIGDVTYSGEVKVSDQGNGKYDLFAGNLALVNASLEDTGENFYIVLYYAHPNGSLDIELRTTDVHSSDGVSIKVEQDLSTITLLPSKFLPKAAAVSDVTAAPTADEFNALLAALRTAGYMAT